MVDPLLLSLPGVLLLAKPKEAFFFIMPPRSFILFDRNQRIGPQIIRAFVFVGNIRRLRMRVGVCFDYDGCRLCRVITYLFINNMA